MPDPVALLGLGAMGAPMAANLARAGTPLTVWNRTASKAEPLRSAGAAVAASPAEAARVAEVIVTMLWDGTAVDEVLFGPDGVVEGLCEAGSAGVARPSALVVDMSTTSPAHPARCAARLAEHGIDFLEAPVTGALPGARDGTLLAMVGGDAATLARALPALAPMIRDARLVGPYGSGQVVKLATNLVGFENILAVCEGLSLAKAAGVDLPAATGVLAESTARSEAVRIFAPLVARGDFEHGLRASLGRKDVGAALAAAVANGIELPAARALESLFAQLDRQGRGDAGCHAIFELLTDGA